MITLSFLKLLENNGFGTIDVDLFFQKLTLDKKGLYISDIGDPIEKHKKRTQSFELYARGDNDKWGYKKLTDILNFLEDGYSTVCTLPSVPPITTTDYEKVTILPTGNITNVGLDSVGRIIYSIQGQIIY